MHSTQISACAEAWVTQLQNLLQQQLAHVGEQVSAFNALQIHCGVEGGRLLIAIDQRETGDLDAQKIFRMLEELIRDCAAELPWANTTADFRTLAPLAVRLSLRGGAWAPINADHTFMLAVTPFVLTAQEPMALATQEPMVLPTGAVPNSLNLEPTQAGKPLVVKRFWYVNPWVACVIVVAGLSGGIGYYAFAQGQPRRSFPVSTPSLAPAAAVMALGRIEPKGEIIKLSVANAQDSRVNQLLVEEGDRVVAGQVIAILQGLDKKKAAVSQAKQNIEIARAKLAKTQVGDAKIAGIAAQQSQIARLEAQLDTEKAEKQAVIAQANAKLHYAKTLYQRYQSLYQSGAASRSEFDQKQEAIETAQAQLAIANAQLDNVISTLQQQIQQERSLLANLSEVRPVDVNVAQAELAYALTQVAQATADLEDLYVRVPTAGQILKINTRVGEQVNTSEGIVELGQTHQMYAIAEVYETDVGKVRVGQRAIVVSENGGFAGEVHGTVERIGLQIKKKNILDADPAAEKDARVVEVKVRIESQDTAKVAGLTNLQVRVRINL